MSSGTRGAPRTPDRRQLRERDLDFGAGFLVEVRVGRAQVPALLRVDEANDPTSIASWQRTMASWIASNFSGVNREAPCPGATLPSVWSTRE